MEAFKSQGVVLVVMDLSKDVTNSAVSWALGNVTRHGDLLRLVGIITHVPNPSKWGKNDNAESVGRFCIDFMQLHCGRAEVVKLYKI